MVAPLRALIARVATESTIMVAMAEHMYGDEADVGDLPAFALPTSRRMCDIRVARMTLATNTPCKQRGCRAAQERDQDPR